MFNPKNLNLFSYTHQNPLKYVDPNGKTLYLNSDGSVDQNTNDGRDGIYIYDKNGYRPVSHEEYRYEQLKIYWKNSTAEARKGAEFVNKRRLNRYLNKIQKSGLPLSEQAKKHINELNLKLTILNEISNEQRPDRVGDVIRKSSKIYGRKEQYQQDGGWEQAKADFDYIIAQLGIREIKIVESKRGTLKAIRLKTGETLIVRSFSSDSRPTLEIQRKNSTGETKATKIRYNE